MPDRTPDASGWTHGESIPLDEMDALQARIAALDLSLFRPDTCSDCHIPLVPWATIRCRYCHQRCCLDCGRIHESLGDA